ncbi:MAG: response regulator [bacterium]
MPKNVTNYSLLISCPSDVKPFLGQINSAIASFNRGYGNKNNIRIETLHWSKDAYANTAKNTTAQGEINKQIVDEADMLIGVFWTRFGQPTQEFGSGTEEEINRMMDANKPVILYFLDKPISPSEIDTEQLQKVNAFKKKHSSDGLYAVLNDEADLSWKLRDELEMRFAKLGSTNETQPERPLPKSILWVDDHPENNTLGREYFVASGIEVIPVLSTEQALRYLSNNTVSVIISDMGRREGPREGYVLLDELRKRGNNTPFLIFAGSNSEKHYQETLRHGGQGCSNSFYDLFNMVSAILLDSEGKQK